MLNINRVTLETLRTHTHTIYLVNRIKEKYNISDKKKINGCNIEELNKQIEELNSILN